MLWMNTSEIWPRSRKYASTLSGVLECTCTLNFGRSPTHSSQSPMVDRKSSASFLSSTSESTRNSLQYVYSLPAQSLICSISTFGAASRANASSSTSGPSLPVSAATKLSMRMARP